MANTRDYKRWTDLEIKSVLNYMIKSTAGRGKFGPKSEMYYKNLIKALKLEVSSQVLKRKIARMKSLYKDFAFWKRLKGAKIQEPSALAAASKQEFKWYVECEKIWGKDMTIHPPYITPAPAIGPPKYENITK